MNEMTQEEIQKLTPPWKAPKLKTLADACNTGACNCGALLRSIHECLEELPHHEIRQHPAIACILGQITSLMRESIGPSFEAIHAYDAWAAQVQPQVQANENTLANAA